MKHLVLFLMLFIGTTVLAQNPMFVEGFISKDSPDYISLITKCKTENAIFVMNHYRSTDTLTSASSFPRMNKKGVLGLPAYFVHGHQVPDSLNVDWNSVNQLYGEYKATISCLKGTVEYVNFIDPILRLQVNLAEKVSLGWHISLFITEDWETYKGVQRIYQNIEYIGGPVNFNMLWERNWNIDSCKIVVIVEDDNLEVIGVKQIGVIESFNTDGIESIGMPKILIYPNPAKDYITIEGNDLKSPIIIMNNLGQIVFNEKSNRINISNLSKGIYFIKIGINTQKLIIE